MTSITFACLQKQDDSTSEAVIQLWKQRTTDDAFIQLSRSEGEDIVKRDREDEDKLAVGIQLAIQRGTLPRDNHVDPTRKIDVVGKTADAVAEEVLAMLGTPSGEGRAIVLQGLSGTGKGTTVKKLQKVLPKCICWSNGNVFRTATHLINAELAKNGVEFSSAALTAELIGSVFARLSFRSVGDDEYDVIIDGTTRVHSICNTELKLPTISARVPTVAEQTQGEVIKFASGAVDVLKRAGYNVILEGRAQTLNYIPTPYRFELVIADSFLLGQRRAAQRVMAAAWDQVKATPPADSAHDVSAAVVAATHGLVQPTKAA